MATNVEKIRAYTETAKLLAQATQLMYEINDTKNGMAIANVGMAIACQGIDEVCKLLELK